MKRLEVHGSLLKGFAESCINLKIIAGIQSTELVHNIDPTGWYPLNRFQQLQQRVLQSYTDSAVILETVGAAMMQGWYEFGPGKNLISDGIGFLHFQSGSDGYVSVVKGPRETIGSFELTDLNLEAGTAVIHSTTPFEKNMERGIIIGGMLAPGDISYVNVDNSKDPNLYEIEFVIGKSSAFESDKLLSSKGEIGVNSLDDADIKDLWWKYRGLKNKWERAVNFWEATNSNLLQAYEKLDKQSSEVGQIFYKAGMADATVDVIHNIGNSINSVLTSADLIGRILQHSKIEELIRINDLLEANSDNLIEYLAQDGKGSKIIEYMRILGSSLVDDLFSCQNEIKHIRDSGFKIEKILHAQRIYLETDNVMEDFNVVTTIEGALRLQASFLEQFSIQVVKLFKEHDILSVNGHQSKLISVLLELFKNSVEAMSSNHAGNRMLIVTLLRDKNMVVIEINDNGEGIHQDNFRAIFNHGFTTRENRYGFGLHNCANYIGEMGGKIQLVQSSEKDGTTFRIELRPA
ncbi:MAG: sensor histidine kinase [Proteobacteria bacterium]|nr:sensor histidine kinase [Pseudomonadota bacterium]